MLDSVTTDHRGRLLEAMAVSITEKGYAATTIADIVGHARVSKRTFYEHFPDKEAAFLATYSAASDIVLGVIATAWESETPWRERLDAGVRAYLGALAGQPALTRTFLVEILAAGPRALELRREVMTRFASGLQALVAEVAADDPSVRPLPDGLALGIAGGVNEMLLAALERGTDLLDLAPAAAELIRAVVTARDAP